MAALNRCARQAQSSLDCNAGSPLRRLWLAILIVLASIQFAGPVHAHKDHQAKQNNQQQTAVRSEPQSAHANMPGMMKPAAAATRPPSFAVRLSDWLGRLHPMIVHFPLAFFPAALFTALVGRRRPGFAKPVQFLVVAGGLTASVSAALGWLGAVGIDPDPMINVHRWLGTAIGMTGLGLALWAWRRPEDDRSVPMVLALMVMTAAMIVQGWYGGALVHGIDHLNW